MGAPDARFWEQPTLPAGETGYAANYGLDGNCRAREGPRHAQEPSLPLPRLRLSSALAACNNEPETVPASGADPQAEALKTAPKVELPPAIAASRTYRCKDNSLVYIDFYTNNTAMYRTEKGGTADHADTRVKAASRPTPPKAIR